MSHARLGLAFALVLLPACTAADPDLDSDTDAPASDADRVCKPLSAPDQFEEHGRRELRRVQLIGGVLHLTYLVAGGVAGIDTFLVRVDDDATGGLLTSREELRGYNRWLHLSGSRYTRMSDGFAVEILDASDPETPVVDELLDLDPYGSEGSGYPSSEHFGDLGLVGSDAFYCWVGEDESPRLMSISLDEPPPSMVGEVVGASQCRPSEHVMTASALWATWLANRITTWDLTAGGAPIATYQYELTSETGGVIASAFTDGRVVAAELDDGKTELLMYPPDAGMHRVSFGVRNALLGVVDGIAYVARPTSYSESDEIVAFDLSVPGRPSQTDLEVVLEAPETTADIHDYVLDDHDEDTLVLHDGNGQVFLLPRTGHARVEPFRLTRTTHAECATP